MQIKLKTNGLSNIVERHVNQRGLFFISKTNTKVNTVKYLFLKNYDSQKVKNWPPVMPCSLDRDRVQITLEITNKF